MKYPVLIPLNEDPFSRKDTGGILSIKDTSAMSEVGIWIASPPSSVIVSWLIVTLSK